VTGDSGLTLGTYWASDTQVNASYTVDAQAPVGQHTVTLRTATGQAQGRIQVAAPPPPTLQVTWNGTPVSSGSTVYITPVPSLPLVASLIPGAQGVTLTATASWTVGINYIGPGSYEYSWRIRNQIIPRQRKILFVFTWFDLMRHAVDIIHSIVRNSGTSYTDQHPGT